MQLLIKRNDRLEQLNNYKAESVLPNEIIDKFSILETNYRRSNDNVVKMIDMIHSDYVDRHELQQLLKELQSKEEGKATKKKADKKITKEEDAIDSTEKALKMLRSEMNQ